MLRNHVENKTQLGVIAKEILDRGDLANNVFTQSRRNAVGIDIRDEAVFVFLLGKLTEVFS